jgi:hypothetical protein
LALVSGVGPDLLGATVFDTIRAYHVVPLFLVVSYVTTLLMAINTAVPTGDRGSAAETRIR